MLRSTLAWAAATIFAIAFGQHLPPSGLYGLDNQQTLLRIYPNATISAIGSNHTGVLQAQQLSVVDALNQILYFIAYAPDSSTILLASLSLIDGTLVPGVPLPFVEAGIVGLGQYIAWREGTGQIIVGGQAADGTHMVGLVDRSSGSYTSVANISSKYGDIVGSSTAAYVPQSDSVIFQLGVGQAAELFSVDISTGAVRQGAVENYTAGLDIQTLDYDKTTGLVYGVGYTYSGIGAAWNRTLVSLDPTSLNITIVGVIPGWGLSDGGLATLDVGDRTLFWMGQVMGQPIDSPLYLLQVSLVNASMMSRALICANATSDGCPMSLDYFNYQS